MSRRARGVELWASLRSLGRDGLASLIERTCRHAQTFARGLRDSGYEVLNDVVLNQVLVSFGAPAVTRAVIDRVQRDGTCWCGGTEWQGRVGDADQRLVLGDDRRRRPGRASRPSAAPRRMTRAMVRPCYFGPARDLADA